MFYGEIRKIIVELSSGIFLINPIILRSGEIACTCCSSFAENTSSFLRTK